MPSITFTDYDNFVEGVAGWADRDDLKSDAIPDAIYLAENELQQSLNFAFTDEILRDSVVKDLTYYELPANFAEAISWVWDNTNYPAPDITSIGQAAAIGRVNGLSNVPRASFFFKNRIYFEPISGPELFTLYYRAGVIHLGPEPDRRTNRLLTEYSGALLYSTLMHLAAFEGNDEGIIKWSQMAKGPTDLAAKAEWRRRTGHGPLRIRSDTRVY